MKKVIASGKLRVYFLDLGTRFGAFLFGNFKRFMRSFIASKTACSTSVAPCEGCDRINL